GIGDGIAIPHAKTDAVTAPGLAAMTIPNGVEYESLDGEPVDLVFLIAAPNTKDNVHLEVLSRLSILLMDDDFTKSLRAAKTKEEFLDIVDKFEVAKLAEEVTKMEQAAESGGYEVLAITACPTGIAHTYMAAEALEKAANARGIKIKVETQGSVGAKNVLSADEIRNAKGIIIAADKKIDLDRFGGKQVLQTNVTAGINKPDELINKILNNEAPVLDGSAAPASGGSTEKESTAHVFYKNLMNGVSHMLPFVVGGGILIAIAFLLDQPGMGTSAYGSSTPLAHFFKQIGDTAFGFMLPILAGFIAQSIADRPGLAVGFVGGALASAGYSFAWLANPDAPLVGGGFLGALLAGFVGGYLTLFLEKACDKLPDSLEGIKPVLIYPLVGIFMIGLVMFAVNPLMAAINVGISNFLNGMGTTNLVLLGAVVGGMMSIDMGGPINKAAYVFGTAMLAEGTDAGKMIMAAVMVGGMVPPIAVALSTTIFKNRWTEADRKAGIVNYIMGLSFISEGAIPYAAADPARVIPSCIAGSAVAGALSCMFGCQSPAPHGGAWVIAVITNPVMYLVALIVGSVVGCLVLSFLKKPLSPEESGLK
ncbi:MAG TPA: PTS fructose transporter subunit IIC, partial [Lachnospiraceae bacterium]|nr:PTS fructose transporter subunit IIC [Lachnospiraceae bacterium]